MAYYAALLHMMDPEKNQEVLPRHIEYLNHLDKEGKILARGPFGDGSGGLVIYQADSFEEAAVLAEKDPHVLEKVRRLELKEWKVWTPPDRA
ncbi:YciI family protein [Domibacillus sp. DTU_2020_1001157_1_SI_ALB_TIR_016]|uniref:YciI family protein n=1 Tax=Domibacillus sp. DTU_2020_1001157_1_SI_ALB_TIR_016 TaxID=3077789 RepID=UPI0028F0BF85|nr:YciI family protein [Domibacillus sp. DTU_2020_1001157_1_SI_ALB_TIR_016]WNS78033.1 YciI family protein [Domibacillus sp. DTU_2020_1001157_1_SI_ALB_TIR_016]